MSSIATDIIEEVVKELLDEVVEAAMVGGDRSEVS